MKWLGDAAEITIALPLRDEGRVATGEKGRRRKRNPFARRAFRVETFTHSRVYFAFSQVVSG